MRFGILKKFLVAFLVIALMPLILLTFYARTTVVKVGQSAVESSRTALLENAVSLIEARARSIARQVELQLEAAVDDLRALSLLPFDEDLYLAFSRAHQRQIWIRAGSLQDPREERLLIPLYKEIIYADATGIERIHVANDQILIPGRDVSSRFRSEHGEENFFRDALGLTHGNIYVSHLLGRHIQREEQLQGAQNVEDAYGGAEYVGIIRLAAPVHRNGRLLGVVSLALDHRHLMEYTQHVQPISTQEVVFPSYLSGNYAFLFDDEGWIITHPKFWDIRGYDPVTGRLIDPLSEDYNARNMIDGRVPFNLFHVPFIHPNYRHAAEEVLQGRSGVTTTSSVGGVSRVLAYAPIAFPHGLYRRTGFFGGVTLGAQTDTFHHPIDETAATITATLQKTIQNFAGFIVLAGLGVGLIAVMLAKSFTRPILLLAHKAKSISSGHFDIALNIHSGDELELLGRNFEDMSQRLESQQQRLLQSFKALEASKHKIEAANRRLQQQVDLLKQIHNTSLFLSLNFDKEQVIDIILKTCVDGLCFERSLLYLHNTANDRLECIKTLGFSAEDQQRALKVAYQIGVHVCIPTQVFTSGQAVMVKDAHTDPHISALDRKIAFVSDTFSFAFAPIRIGEHNIGVLGADHATSKRQIREEEMEALKIIANEAGMAIERSRLMAEAVRERDFIENIFANMMSGLLVIDHHGVIRTMNQHAQHVLALPAHEAIGRATTTALAVYPQLNALAQKAAAQARELNTDLKLLLPDGTHKYLEVATSTLHDKPLPRQRSTLLIFRDVTERKNLERQLRRSDRLVSLGTLAAGVAHEIRNPLTGISLLLDDLHDRLINTPDERSLIQAALEEIEKLEKIVTELLEFASNPSASLAPKNINHIIDQLIFLVKKQCHKQGILLQRRPSNHLPPVCIDAEKIKQAFLNIILNAVKVLPSGGHIDIQTGLREDMDLFADRPCVEVVISDNGPGILPEHIDYIFDPFFTHSPDGFGLGLAIAHTIIQEHNGKIIVESAPGQGACFKIYFPVFEEPYGKDTGG